MPPPVEEIWRRQRETSSGTTIKGFGVVFRHDGRETLTSGVNRANAEAQAMWSRALPDTKQGDFEGSSLRAGNGSLLSPERARKSLGITGFPETIDSVPVSRERARGRVCRTRVQERDVSLSWTERAGRGVTPPGDYGFLHRIGSHRRGGSGGGATAQTAFGLLHPGLRRGCIC